MPSEFELIARHFMRPTRHTELAAGDDAALLRPRWGMQVAVSTDMLVAGTHFLADTDPHALGWKAAAVNISDIAAMGGEPRWITLAISLPAPDEAWIAALADGFAQCCSHFDVDWIGGDTTRGPLNLCPTVFGEIPAGQAVTRKGSCAGDDIWISGTPGLAALGLDALLGRVRLQADWLPRCIEALQRPLPRVALGIALRGHATAMLDVSDGLAGDLRHLLEAAAIGAVLDETALPLAAPLGACGDPALARSRVLHGGDDYELLFTAPAGERAYLTGIADTLELPLHRIGQCETATGLRLRRADGGVGPLAARGFDHFGS